MENLIKNKKALIAVGIITILVIISITIWYFSSISRVNKNQEEIEVTIPLGSGSSTIADILKENKLIKSKSLYYYLVI